MRVRSYISEPARGRRNWKKNPKARDAVYRNRRRIRGPRGLRLLRLRGERLERPFAHLYETDGMRRVHLRGHTNIRKRLLIHAGGFNLGLFMRQLIGVGTPRGLQGRVVAILGALLTLADSLWARVTGDRPHPCLVQRGSYAMRRWMATSAVPHISVREMVFTTGWLGPHVEIQDLTPTPPRIVAAGVPAPDTAVAGCRRAASSPAY